MIVGCRLIGAILPWDLDNVVSTDKWDYVPCRRNKCYGCSMSVTDCAWCFYDPRYIVGLPLCTQCRITLLHGIEETMKHSAAWITPREVIITMSRVALLRRCEMLPENKYKVGIIPMCNKMGLATTRCHWCRTHTSDEEHLHSFCKREIARLIATACMNQTRKLYIAALPLPTDITKTIDDLATSELSYRAAFLESAELLLQGYQAKKEE